MNKHKLNSNFLLLFTSIIWGFGFVAQEKGAQFLGPNMFNGARYSIGAICLFAILIIYHRCRFLDGFWSRDWVKSSLSAGGFLFLGSFGFVLDGLPPLLLLIIGDFLLLTDVVAGCPLLLLIGFGVVGVIL